MSRCVSLLGLVLVASALAVHSSRPPFDAFAAPRDDGGRETSDLLSRRLSWELVRRMMGDADRSLARMQRRSSCGVGLGVSHACDHRDAARAGHNDVILTHPDSPGKRQAPLLRMLRPY